MCDEEIDEMVVEVMKRIEESKELLERVDDVPPRNQAVNGGLTHGRR